MGSALYDLAPHLTRQLELYQVLAGPGWCILATLVEQSIQLATQSWPNLSSPGDPNTIDVYWLASCVRGYLGAPLPTKVPDRRTGVAIVECIESGFIRGSLIRRAASHNWWKFLSDISYPYSA